MASYAVLREKSGNPVFRSATLANLANARSVNSRARHHYFYRGMNLCGTMKNFKAYQQILQDAKKLSDRLKEHDTAADVLLSQTQSVYKQIDAMKHYADDLAELNETARQGPHGEIIAGLQQESRQLRELQIENRELKLALQDYQNAVELIMSKYRTHTTQLLAATKLDLKTLASEHQNQIIAAQAEKISEMAAVMIQAASYVEEKEVHLEEIIAALKIENKGLRELLNISTRYGSTNTMKRNVPEAIKES